MPRETFLHFVLDLTVIDLRSTALAQDGCAGVIDREVRISALHPFAKVQKEKKIQPQHGGDKNPGHAARFSEQGLSFLSSHVGLRFYLAQRSPAMMDSA